MYIYVYIYINSCTRCSLVYTFLIPIETLLSLLIIWKPVHALQLQFSVATVAPLIKHN